MWEGYVGSEKGRRFKHLNDPFPIGCWRREREVNGVLASFFYGEIVQAIAQRMFDIASD